MAEENIDIFAYVEENDEEIEKDETKVRRRKHKLDENELQMEYQENEEIRKRNREKRKSKISGKGPAFMLANLIVDHLEPYILHLGFSSAVSGATRVVEMLYPIVIGTTIDTLRGRPPSWMTTAIGSSEDSTTLIPSTIFILTLLFVSLFLIQSLFEWLYTIVATSLGEGLKHSIRMEIYDKIQQREINLYCILENEFKEKQLYDLSSSSPFLRSNYSSGDASERKMRRNHSNSLQFNNDQSFSKTRSSVEHLLNFDCDQIERLLVKGIKDIIQVATSIGFGCLVMLLVDWKLMIVGLSPLPFVIVVSLFYWNKVEQLLFLSFAPKDHFDKLLDNLLNYGIYTMKEFGNMEIFEFNHIASASRSLQSSLEKFQRMKRSYEAVVRLLMVIGVTGVLSLGSYWILRGDYDDNNNSNSENESSSIFSVGDLVYFLLTIPQVIIPVSRLGKTLQLYRKSFLSIVRMSRFIIADSLINDVDNPIDHSDDPLSIINDKGNNPNNGISVKFEDVEFSYPAYDLSSFTAYSTSSHIINKLSFEIPAKSCVSIIGSPTSGKYAIANLIMRLYDATGGTISYSGIDIKKIKLFDLHRYFSVVNSETYIFEGTIAENLNYGSLKSHLRPDVRTELTQIAKKVKLTPLIEKVGLDMVLSEGGPELTPSEKLLFGFARALRKNSPLLILNDPTSNVDWATHKLLLEYLDEFIEGKTVIIITDHLSLARLSDHILVLENGTVKESGDHDYLIENGTFYPQLWSTYTGALGPRWKGNPQFPDGDIRNFN